jgi:dimethylamine/trimethylamine dehydrogenase
VREVTRKPVVGVGRYTDPDQMAEVVRRGALDIIGAARPSIADPFLPRKIEEGRYDEIRECIGCNICISRAIGTGRIACTQNPTAGEEYRRGWHPEHFTKASDPHRTVLVVGAGVAGMECAIVLGRRGYERVHLVERAAGLGGYAALVATLPHLGEWRRLVDWRVAQLEKLANVDVITGLDLDARAAAGYGADVIVVAAGAVAAGRHESLEPRADSRGRARARPHAGGRAAPHPPPTAPGPRSCTTARGASWAPASRSGWLVREAR